MKKLLLTACFLVSFIGLTSAHSVPYSSEDVMLQGFAWNSHNETKWEDLQKQAGEIASSFTLIWLPPASSGEYGGSSNMGYHPYQYSNLNSSWGNKNSLQNLIRALNRNGCKAIADVVINHKSGNARCGNFPKEFFGKYGSFEMPNTFICKDDEEARGCQFGNNYDSGEKYPAARDLDHKSPKFQKAVIGYLNWLTKEIGFSGFRYDMTKGYGPQYNKIYNNATQPYLSVGEYFDGNYDLLKNWVEGSGRTSMTFDFSMKYAIRDWGGGSNYGKLAWMDGSVKRPAGLAHSADMRQFAVTFIDNHDTSSPHEGWQDQQYMGDIEKANAFLLSAPGIPCVFWKHWTKHKPAIKKMIAARRGMGINSNSDVKVTNTNGYYECIAIGTRGKLICQIWHQNVPAAPAGYTKACGGNGWAYYTTKPIVPGVEVHINPDGGYVGPNGKVTLTATQGATIYYTTNGSTPTASSTRYTQPIIITKEGTVVKAIAIKGNKQSIVAEATFYVEKGVSVQFKKPSTWTEVNVYAWVTTAGGTAKELNGKWPGGKVEANSKGSYSFDAPDYDMINIIFNAGTGKPQTTDLEARGKVCFDGTNATQVEDNKIEPGKCVYVGVEEVVETPISIYPNPTDGIINVTAEKEISYIIVRNLAGRTVATSITNQVDMGALAPSLYLVEVLFNDGDKTLRKVIRK